MTGAGAKTATEDEDAMASEAIINEISPAKGKKKEKKRKQTKNQPACNSNCRRTSEVEKTKSNKIVKSTDGN
jgi:hypothetical protein